MSPHPHPPVCRACWSCWCACLGATLLTACATPRSDAHLLALRGGVLDPTRPYVVSLGDAEGFVCTGTIVSPHVVLTAGHCGTTRHLDWVEVGTEHIPITERVRHPDYGAPFHENDLQLLRTSEALGLEPAPLLREELDNSARFVGPPWTFVGRGRLEPGGSFGEPHVMVRPIRSVARGLYTFDGMTGAVDPTELLHEGDEAGMCPGDSGAPGFVVVDGIERLAAVHSRSEPSCSGVALAARADLPAIGLFLQPTIDRFEDAEPCRADGACAPECEGESRVRDPDCAALHCGSDGVCAASCVRPVDPDCSIEACVADGRCVPSCALDPDCSEPPPPAADAGAGDAGREAPVGAATCQASGARRSAWALLGVLACLSALARRRGGALVALLLTAAGCDVPSVGDDASTAGADASVTTARADASADARAADAGSDTTDAASEDAVVPSADATVPIDLGHALHRLGYTATIWTNSFDPAQPHAAHGLFDPDVPIDTTGYAARYGMTLIASGSASVAPDGHLVGTGTVTTASGGAADGSLTVDLFEDGARVDSALTRLACPAGDVCSWSVTFGTTAAGTHAWTVTAYRHIQGSVCGGEASVDLNGTCHDALTERFGLPRDYVFTTTDWHDTNYVSRPGATSSVQCLEIMPLCGS